MTTAEITPQMLMANEAIIDGILQGFNAKLKDFQDKIIERLTSIKQATLLQTKDVLTVEDVTLLTGIPKSTIYKMTSKGEIPYHKPSGTGGKLYFDKNELNSWMLRNKRESRQEIEDEADTWLATH